MLRRESALLCEVTISACCHRDHGRKSIESYSRYIRNDDDVVPCRQPLSNLRKHRDHCMSLHSGTSPTMVEDHYSSFDAERPRNLLDGLGCESGATTPLTAPRVAIEIVAHANRREFPMFVVTVLSFDNERTSKVFGAISDARRWASADALNEFDGDVCAPRVMATSCSD